MLSELIITGDGGAGGAAADAGGVRMLPAVTMHNPVDSCTTSMRDDVKALMVAVERAPQLPVPSCPGWRVVDVVGHLASKLRWTDILVRARANEPVTYEEPRMSTTAMAPALSQAVTGLIETFSEVPLDEQVWSPTGDNTAGMWLRHAALEAALHRWDVEAAFVADGLRVAPPALPSAELACSGIDEILALAVHAVPGGGETLHLHATDTGPDGGTDADADPEGEWFVTFGRSRLLVERRHAKGDVAVRATAADLLLLLWGRRSWTTDGYEVFGDDMVLRRWQHDVRV
jgi:uncharacterized protein (TIGR03083 family)